MKTYLTSYAQKCLGEVADYVDITDVAEVPKNVILAQATNVSSWTDFQNKNSYMFYVLGPLDAELFEEKPPVVESGIDAQSAV